MIVCDEILEQIKSIVEKTNQIAFVGDAPWKNTHTHMTKTSELWILTQFGYSQEKFLTYLSRAKILLIFEKSFNFLYVFHVLSTLPCEFFSSCFLYTFVFLSSCRQVFSYRIKNQPQICLFSVFCLPIIFEPLI